MHVIFSPKIVLFTEPVREISFSWQSEQDLRDTL